MEDVRSRLEKGMPILFKKTDPFLYALSDKLQKEDKATIVIWAFSLINEAVSYLSARYPDVQIFNDAVKTVQGYLGGNISFESRRNAIKALHNTASFIEDKSDKALIHAVGQALSTASTRKHAMGFVLFELTSIVLEEGLDQGLQKIPERLDDYYEMLEIAREKAQNLPSESIALIEEHVR